MKTLLASTRLALIGAFFMIIARPFYSFAHEAPVMSTQEVCDVITSLVFCFGGIALIAAAVVNLIVNSERR